MTNEIIAAAFATALAIIAFFLKALHSDHEDLKKRILQQEIEAARSSAAHSAMGDALAELREAIKQLPSQVMGAISPRLDRLERLFDEKK